MSVASQIRVRVWVPEVWDAVWLDLEPETTVEALKQRALAAATGRRADPQDYVVKYRGGVVADESVTVAALGVADGAPFIVLPARRQPVR